MNIQDYARGVLLIHKFQEEVYNRIVEFHINNNPMTFMKTKPFTIEGCKANGNRAVTRDGRIAMIFDYDSDGYFPITGRVLRNANATTWREDGFTFDGAPSHPFDLFLPCKATLRPWTPEEAIGKVVRLKGDSDALAVITWAGHPRTHTRSNFGDIKYEDLLKDYTQMDGSPCGVEVEE